eukprot:9408876-Pyramimonas_sp.AAC.1
MERDRHGCGRNARPAQSTGPQWIVNYEELEEAEAHAIRTGTIPDGHAALDTACPRGSGGSLALGGCADGHRATARMRGSPMRFRGVNDSALVMADGEQEAAAGLAGAGVNLRIQRLPKSKTPILLGIH